MVSSKVQKIKESLVRYIADLQLGPGDKLPSQNELRLSQNVGSATISTAIRSLAQDNILEIRDKVGVFVNQNGLDGHTGRNAAILINCINSIYIHILVSELQEQLQKVSCQNMVFMCPPDKDSLCLENYPGFMRNVRQNNISMVFLTTGLDQSGYEWLDESKASYISLIKNQLAPYTCAVDMHRYVKESFDYLLQKGARRLAIVAYGHKLGSTLNRAFQEQMQLHFPHIDCDDCIYLANGFEASRNVVGQILSTPKSQRPDALIYTGDLIMQGVSVWLHRIQVDLQDRYTPHATAILNRQNPIMPIDSQIAVFEADVHEQSIIAVKTLLDYVRGGEALMNHSIPARLMTQQEYFSNSNV